MFKENINILDKLPVGAFIVIKDRIEYANSILKGMYININDLLLLIKDNLNKEDFYYDSIAFRDRYLKISVNYYNKDDYYIIIVEDITNTHLMKERLKINEKLYHFAINHSKMKLLEYNHLTNSFNPQLPIESIHNDCIDKFNNFYKEMIEGKRSDEIKLKIKVDDEYQWFLIKYENIFNDENKLIKAIGIVQNIDEHIQLQSRYKKVTSNHKRLVKQATSDDLTGLVNRRTLKERVSDELLKINDDNYGALFMVDIDDFKLINDKLGHQCGDEALCFIAKCLLTTFRSNDIVGRIGGDEFMVYMKSVIDRNDVISKAILLNDLLKDNPFNYELSCSIGVCFVDNNNFSFDEVYLRADKSVYESKKLGKNRYSIYS